MKYITEFTKNEKAVAVEDTILTEEGLSTADAVVRLKNAGYSLAGKANVGEFGLDVIGETSYYAP